jgi:hypothetical protein
MTKSSALRCAILAGIALVSEARGLASRVPDDARVRVDGSTGEVVWEE